MSSQNQQDHCEGSVECEWGQRDEPNHIAHPHDPSKARYVKSMYASGKTGLRQRRRFNRHAWKSSYRSVPVSCPSSNQNPITIETAPPLSHHNS
jgi:hypothetical protein